MARAVRLERPMLDMHPYLIALCGTALLCFATWAFKMADAVGRCMSVIAAVWLAGFCFGSLSGDLTHWQFNILIDSLAAIFILHHPAAKMQAALGGTYAVQIVFHLTYGANEFRGTANPLAYYEMLTMVAYAQLAIMTGWSIGIWGRRIGHRLRRRYPALDRWASGGSLGRSK